MQKNIIPNQEVKYTNQVLFCLDGKAIDLFIPAYIMLTSKKIYQVQVTQESAMMVSIMKIALNVKGLPRDIISNQKDGLDKYLDISINNQLHFRLDTNTQNCDIQHDIEQEIIQYTYRQTFYLRMKCNIFLTPYDVQDLGLLITLRTMQKTLNHKKINLKFNCMDVSDLNTKFNFGDHSDIGQFGIAQSKVKVEYTNDQKTFLKDQKTQKKKQQNKKLDSKNQKINQDKPKKEEKIKIKHYQSAIFYLALYRIPNTTILTLFIPIWLLGVINIAIYFQQCSFKDRIANLTLVMVAYMAFFPTVRDKIPPSANFTIIDIILYALLMTSLLTLISSGYTDGTEVSQWIWYQNIFFILSLSIVILTALIVCILGMMYRFIWSPSYNSQAQINDQINKKIPYINWQNKNCDKEFFKLKNHFKPILDLKMMKLIKFD